MMGVVVKVEGVDGSGKTTLLDHLARHYAGRLDAVTTAEFGNDFDTTGGWAASGRAAVGRTLYDFVLDPGLAFDDHELHIALALASRRQNRVVLPALAAKASLVLSDRSTATCWAYGHHLGRAHLQLLDEVVRPVAREHLVLWIDLEPAKSFARVAQREPHAGHARFEKDLAYQENVAHHYRRLAAEWANVERLDGELAPQEVAAEAVALIDHLLVAHELPA